MLDLRQNSGANSGKAIARNAATSRADAGKVILLGVDIAPPPIRRAIGQIIRLDDHLIEGVVPAHLPGLTMIFVPLRDFAEVWIELAVARLQEPHETVRRDTIGHTVVR